jgi:cobalt/nickel transport system permease protein
LHHVILDRWSRRESFIHARDARAKTLALLVFLVLVATTRKSFGIISPIYFLLLLGTLAVARLPIRGALKRAAVVLPFTMAFALVSVIAGEPHRAVALTVKSYISALAVLVLVATTPLPQLLRSLESLGVPRFLLMVAQFVYRYLFVISEQAQHMRLAALCRGSAARSRAVRDRFRAAAGALAVLFARSYERAEAIHRSMIARGFQGHFRLLYVSKMGWRDAAFLLIVMAVPAGCRLAVELWV